MTLKEKAKELYDKMCLAIATETTEFGYYTNVIHAKKCALIAVDDKIEFFRQIILDFHLDENEKALEIYRDLKKFKSEIEKL
jgi:hypothetical protein